MGDELETVAGRQAPHFTRREPETRGVASVRGLLRNAERKSGWQLAEEMGNPTPDGVQHLLARAGWDADAVLDELLRSVAERPRHSDWVLIVDETGFLKKDIKSAGNIRGQRDGLRTHRSVLPWVTPASVAGSRWTGSRILRRTGQSTSRGVRKPASPKR